MITMVLSARVHWVSQRPMRRDATTGAWYVLALLISHGAAAHDGHPGAVDATSSPAPGGREVLACINTLERRHSLVPGSSTERDTLRARGRQNGLQQCSSCPRCPLERYLVLEKQVDSVTPVSQLDERHVHRGTTRHTRQIQVHLVVFLVSSRAGPLAVSTYPGSEGRCLSLVCSDPTVGTAQAGFVCTAVPALQGLCKGSARALQGRRMRSARPLPGGPWCTQQVPSCACQRASVTRGVRGGGAH